MVFVLLKLVKIGIHGTVDFVETSCRMKIMNDGRMIPAYFQDLQFPAEESTVQPNHSWFFVPPWPDAFGPFPSRGF